MTDASAAIGGKGAAISAAWRALAVSVVLVLCWHAAVTLTGVPPFIFPGPVAVGSSLFDNAGLIAFHASFTAIEILAGLVIGVTLGLAVALVMMQWRLVRGFLQPLMVFSQAVPVFALAPLLTLWFGYGLGSKIVMTTLIIFFPVAATFYDGLRNTPAALLDLAISQQARPVRTLFFVRVPAALPALASGLRLAAVYAPIGAVIGEWVGASRGLGYLMLLANGRVKTDLMFASLLVLAALAIALYFGMGILANRLQRWSGQSA